MEPIKAYQPRHGLRLFRYEENITFQCNRCGEAKKSKLQASYDSVPGRSLCNGCYGFLLSVLDVREQRANDDAKADLLSALLLQGFSKAQKQDAERRLRLSEKRFAYLDQRSILFVSTSELVQTALLAHCDLDWSPGIIGYCKAVENEIVRRLVLPTAANLTGRVPKHELDDKDIGRMAKFCHTPDDRPPELGAFAHFLQTFIHSSSRRGTSQVMQTFQRNVNAFPKREWILDPSGLHRQISVLTQEYRNKAAHLSALTEADYVACRDFVIGLDGLLWKLVEATLDQKTFNKA